MEKIKLLYYGDGPCADTGFGTVAHNILLRLLKTERYTIICQAINYYGDPLPKDLASLKDLTIFRCFEHDVQGQSRIGELLFSFNPDVLFINNDYDAVNWLWPIINAVNQKLEREIPCIFYHPVDGFPFDIQYVDMLRRFVKYPVTYTKFAQDVIKKADPTMEIPYVYHGVNTRDFFPLSESKRREIKDKLNLKDKFVVFSGGVNQLRKQYATLLEVFNIFRQDKDNVVLYLHCEERTQYGWNIDQIVRMLKLENHVILTKGISGPVGLPYHQMNFVYNSADIAVFPQCFLPGTKILTNPGVSNIENVKIGQTIINGNGQYDTVIRTMAFKYNGKICRIKPGYLPCFEVTADHTFPILHNKQHEKPGEFKRKIKKNKIKFSTLKAENIKSGDFAVIPRFKEINNIKKIKITDVIKNLKLNKYNKIIVYGKNRMSNKFIHPKSGLLDNELKLTHNLLKLFGLYLSEGCVSKDSVIFSVNSTTKKHLIDEIIRIMKLYFPEVSHNIYHMDRHRVNIVFYNTILSKFFGTYLGNKAQNKKIPHTLLSINPELQLSLVKGMWLGDGSNHKTKISWTDNTVFDLSYSTTSEQLAYQLHILLTRLGFLNSLEIRTNRLEYNNRICGSRSKKEFLSLFGIKYDPKKSSEKGWMDETYMYVPIDRIEFTHYDGIVHNLTIANEHTYISSIKTNNCGEGFGLMIAEAMSAGIPIIAHNATAIPEVVRDGGILVPTERIPDPKHPKKKIPLEIRFPFGDRSLTRPIVSKSKLLEAMNELYYDEDKRKKLGTKARETILNESKFNWDYVANYFDQLIEKAIKETDVLDLDLEEII